MPERKATVVENNSPSDVAGKPPPREAPVREPVGEPTARPSRPRPGAKLDVYKLKAELLARDLESLRQAEWRVTFQLYVGYTAVAFAYSRVRSEEILAVIAGASSIVLTLILFWTTFYSLLKLHERLHDIHEMQRGCMAHLHQISGVSELPLTTRGALLDGYDLFVAQTILNSVAAAVLIAYELATTMASVASK
jgi:hypothetical protein